MYRERDWFRDGVSAEVYDVLRAEGPKALFQGLGDGSSLVVFVS